MQPMSAAEIRERFQRFFEERGHTRVPSAPLLARDDPTLLFVNSGMAPFKRVLTGEEKRDYVRAVDAQLCLRVAGRHNDFEEVGRTPRHNTLFEMLGNWSFGDYFKREAIHWHWELLTSEFGLDPDRLAATVYTDDDEAAAIWTDEIGLPAERLVRWGNIAGRRREELLEHGRDRPVRTLQRAALRPRHRALGGTGVHPRPLRALPSLAGGWEPRLHAVRPGRRRDPLAPPVQER